MYVVDRDEVVVVVMREAGGVVVALFGGTVVAIGDEFVGAIGEELPARTDDGDIATLVDDLVTGTDNKLVVEMVKKSL